MFSAFRIAAQVLADNIFSEENETLSRYEDNQSSIATTRYSGTYSYDSSIELAERKRHEDIAKYSSKHKELKYDYKNASRMLQAARSRHSDLRSQVWSLNKDITDIQNSQKGWQYFSIVVNDIRLQVIPLLKATIEARSLGVEWKHIIAFSYRALVDSASKKAESFESYKLKLIQTKQQIESQSDSLWIDIKRMEGRKEEIRRKKKKAKKKKKKLKSGC